MAQRFDPLSFASHRRLPALLFGLIYLATALILQPGAQGLILAAALAPALIWASVTDLDRHVIPDTASLWVAAVGLGLPLWQGAGPDWPGIGLALAVTLTLGAAGAWYWRRHGTEALGLGDAKLIGAGTLVIGAQNLWLMILLAASGGLVAGLLARRRAQKGIPFGPFLAYAIFGIAVYAGGEGRWH